MASSSKTLLFLFGGMMAVGLTSGAAIFSVNRALDSTDLETAEITAELVVAREIAETSFQTPDVAAWSADALRVRFERVNYDLASIRNGGEVPRLFVNTLPGDLAEVKDVQTRKDHFIRTVLPLVLAENDRIHADRRLVRSVRDRTAAGLAVEATERAAIEQLARTYQVQPQQLDELLNRVDEVPVSLALAQAVEESGWGTSRFAREGNALFGQWTTDASRGILPADREAGKNHLIRKFDSLADSVAGYMRNINTHRAYRHLRADRAERRESGRALDGYALAGHLTSYSERGQAYVDGIRSLMRVNKLGHFDTARLKDSEVALVVIQ